MRTDWTEMRNTSNGYLTWQQATSTTTTTTTSKSIKKQKNLTQTSNKSEKGKKIENQ